MKTIHPEHLDIQIDHGGRRVFFTVEDHRDAELIYKLHDNREPNIMEFTHTYVPPSLRNAGLGGRLAQKGLRLAESNGYKVVPTCPFVEDYIEKHPQFKPLVATGGL